MMWWICGWMYTYIVVIVGRVHRTDSVQSLVYKLHAVNNRRLWREAITQTLMWLYCSHFLSSASSPPKNARTWTWADDDERAYNEHLLILLYINSVWGIIFLFFPISSWTSGDCIVCLPLPLILFPFILLYFFCTSAAAAVCRYIRCLPPSSAASRWILVYYPICMETLEGAAWDKYCTPQLFETIWRISVCSSPQPHFGAGGWQRALKRTANSKE